jgi:ADP-heptose:LPS heptosyltransferase
LSSIQLKLLKYIKISYSIFKYLTKQLFLNFDLFIKLGLKSKQKNGIVLIRLDAIGDFVIWLDSAKEYRRIYPNQKITLVANAAWATIARELPYWDDVWSINILNLTRKPFYRWAILRKVRRANFETAIQPTFSRAILHGDSVIRATCSKHRIGSVGDTSNISASDKLISDQWYTQLLTANSMQLMELLRNAEFITKLTCKDFTANLPKLPVMTALSKHLKVKEDYVILFPGASWHGREWPIQKFSDVGEHLHKQYGWKIMLCGAPTDNILCQAIEGLLSITCLNMAGQTTLQELTELIRGAKILISNDTSAVHMAAAVGTPVVCILGGGHFGRFLPYPEHLTGVKPAIAIKAMACFNCNWKCNQPHDPADPVPCISEVSVDKVLELVKQELV